MNIEIEKTSFYRIAYIRQVGSYGQNNIKVMEKLKKWAKSTGLLNEQSIILGIAHDNPKIVEPKNCRYDTGLVISNDYCISDDYISDGSIPGGEYAVFKIRHTTEEVQKAWLAIFPELFKKGYQLDEARPILERYKTEMVRKHFCEICVPIH
ncbi:GyrI-like domain-containing protein [Clostridium estertheticum]|uniref:AraC family transcriptional regulator n=1 Tax=Clostridium estertheticum TaxID=238834 RepID=UPI001CF3A218|nr:GyrI-like domain-containing protein [Clostridium estertheticum]MCB2309140.1 GyrI-like domain-containing protein [Clostridium estertheticum]MCB2344868.1 GyrI-like domain-containing protein [Clostridium estertheticum]MCB2349966.1 GyrI-like domain-containing protein [Clostridium estertheticum]WAG48115.1 GyrI-like domain-containing protein [Clostridium estertheticum]